MSRRHVNLAEELPPYSRWLLELHQVPIEKIQAWLDSPDCDFDGASGVSDWCLPAEAVHDWLYRTSKSIATRALADWLFREIMLDWLANSDDDAWVKTALKAKAYWRWVGVRVFGNPFWGIVKAQSWNPLGKRIWVP